MKLTKKHPIRCFYPKVQHLVRTIFNTLQAFKAFQVVAFAVRENVQETYSIPLDPLSNLGRLLQNNEGASSAWGCLVVVVSPHKMHIPVSAQQLGRAPVLVQMTRTIPLITGQQPPKTSTRGRVPWLHTLSRSNQQRPREGSDPKNTPQIRPLIFPREISSDDLIDFRSPLFILVLSIEFSEIWL